MSEFTMVYINGQKLFVGESAMFWGTKLKLISVDLDGCEFQQKPGAEPEFYDLDDLNTLHARGELRLCA